MKLILNPEYRLYEKDNKIFCDSLQIAETFNKRHDNILGDIKRLNCSSEFRLLNFKESSYKNNQNKNQPMYLLTKDGFVLLVMGYTGKNAMRFKEAYINRFNQMESFISSLQTVKLEFPEFTDAILNAHEEPKHYHFSNEINMINKIVLGATAKEFKESNNLDPGVTSIRPYLTEEQLKGIEALQKFDIGLITMENDYQKRKETLTNYYYRLLNRRLLTA